MDILTRRSSSSGLSCLESDLAFDATVECPDVVAALVEDSPAVSGVLDALRRRIPLAPSTADFGATGFYRLPGHYRSLCFALTGGCTGEGLYDSEVIVFKGTEPLLSDYAEYVRWMRTARFRLQDLPLAEYLPLVQGTAPGTLTMFEAMREQRITTRLHQLHLRHYGDLARIPVPLAVHRLSDGENARCAERLRPLLSAASFERVNPVLRKGLAIAVFYYPSAPIRADYFASVDTLRPRMRRVPLVDTMIQGWATLFARVLYLGYMPFAPWGMMRGSCFDPGNAAIDGGVFDCDSLVPLEMVSDNRHFYRALLTSLDILRRSVVAVMKLAANEKDQVFRFLSTNYVNALVRAAIETEARPGLEMDSRVFDCVSSPRISSLETCIAGAPLSDEPYTSGMPRCELAASA